MRQAKQGDTVRVQYHGKLQDGSVFDASDREPLEFTIGEGNLIPGFEQGVIGMGIGDTKTVTIPAEQAYGLRMEQLVAVVERKEIPEHIKVEVGSQLEVSQEDGQTFPVLITEVTDTHVTLDANHPLAGRNLIFDLRLVEIG